MSGTFHPLAFCFLALSLGGAAFAQEPDAQKLKKGLLLEVPAIERAPVLSNAFSTIIFEETFESGGSGWTESGSWAIGAPTSGPGSGYNSTRCAATNLAGNYSNQADDWLISPTIVLPALSSSSQLTLVLMEWFQLESGYDYGFVNISIDGGLTWTTSSSRDGAGNWRQHQVDLTPYSNQQIKLGFQLTSDGGITYPGWYVDNVQISRNDPEPLSATLTSLNSQNFPFIYMNVAVDTFEVGFPGLTQSNFGVYENNVLQTDYFQVVPPDAGAGVRLADIVFLMDNSGSMSEEIAAVSNNVITFVNNLASSGVNFAVGLCRYGGDENSGNPIIEDNGILATDADYFKNTVWQRNYSAGGTEPGYYAITQSTSRFNFRPGAQKIFIIITDETPDQGGASRADALAALTNNSITLFALSESSLFSYFGSLTSATNGQYFDIYSPFDEILDFITSQVSNSYVVSYRSSNPVIDGTTRTVRVEVTYHADSDTAVGSYIPGSAPTIQRTAATIALHNQAWAEGTRLVIEAEIVDNVAPYVQNAQLFYKHTNVSAYSPVTMTRQAGNVYRGTVPASAVRTPGLDYYLTASDGASTSSDPTTNPATHPYQLAILPNVAPVITHTPVTTLTPGTSIDIVANIVDNTNSLASAKLFYRKTGQLIYQQAAMTPRGGSDYEATIPSAYVTKDGVDYYIYAVDDFGVGSYRGTADYPYQIFVPLDMKLLLLSPDPNPSNQRIMEGGLAHRYYRVTDINNKLLENAVLEYHFINRAGSYYSMPSDTAGLIDLYMNVGGSDPNTPADDWARAGTSVTVEVKDAKRAGYVLNIVENQITSFPLNVEERQFERSWDVLLGAEVGAGGSVGSVGLGPLGVAALKASVKAKGGLGYNITLLKNSKSQDKIKVARRVEAGIGGELSTGKITAVGRFRIGAEAQGTAVFRGEQSYLFENPYSDDEKMAQAGLLLETLAIGNIPASPALGLVVKAIVEVLNEGAGADQILSESRYSTGVQGGFEGSVGAGFKTELISSAFSRIVNVKLPNAESSIGFYFGLDEYFHDPFAKRSGKYLTSFDFDNVRYKIYLQEAGGFEISALATDIDNGLPFSLDVNFLPNISKSYGGLLGQAAYFDRNWSFQGIELTFEWDATRSFSAVEHDITTTYIYIPQDIVKAFADEVTTNASQLAIAGLSSAKPLGYAVLGVNALTADCAHIITESVLEALDQNWELDYDEVKTDASIIEGNVGLDLELAAGIGISIFIGANFNYVDGHNFLQESGKLVSRDHGFLEISNYAQDNYVTENPQLRPLVENMINGIWPLIRNAVAGLVDWVGDVIRRGQDWAAGWWPGTKKVFASHLEELSWMRLSGKGDELPDNSHVQVSRYSPHLNLSPSSRQIYKSSRITHGRKISSLTTEGLVVGIGKCYQVSAIDRSNNRINVFQDSCNLTFLVSNQEVLASGLSLDKKESIRIYRYAKETNSWAAVSKPLARSDSLSAKILETGAYMLGIEFEPDSLPPSLGNLTPPPNSFIGQLTEISAIVGDDGSGVDIFRTAIALDSSYYPIRFDSKTSRVYVHPNSLPTLSEGSHHIIISVYDRAGNLSELEYEFIVGQRDGNTTYFYPNPFNPDMEIGAVKYTFSQSGNVNIEIYDAANTLVKTLVKDVPNVAGLERSARWDGRNDRDEIVANGVYFYVIESSSGEKAIGKVAVLR